MYPKQVSGCTPEKLPRVDALSKNGAETLDLIPGLCTAKKNQGLYPKFFCGLNPLLLIVLETGVQYPGYARPKKIKGTTRDFAIGVDALTIFCA